MRTIRLFPIIALAVLWTQGGRAAGWIDEVRFGGYGHDVSVFGHQKEKGADINAELLFEPLEFLWEPRPVVGVLGNTSGDTSQVYFGLTWTWDFLHQVLTREDGLYAELTLGGSLNDGKLNVTDQAEAERRKSLGSHILFREDLDLGYRLNKTWSIAISYNHISNADLANRNEGINDLGVRVGYKF